jgi:hypothetical protein
MRRVELWADPFDSQARSGQATPDRRPLHLDRRVISLEPIKRARHDDAIRDAFDEGTVVGFFLGVLAMALVWLILSGLLVHLAVVVVHAVFGGRG